MALTHLNQKGEAHIVDIGDKATTRRRAVATARLEAQPETLALIMGGELKKGDALAVARVAGIMAAKKTAELIPLCHPIPLSKVEVEIVRDADTLLVTATAETTALGSPMRPVAKADMCRPFCMNRATVTKTEVAPSMSSADTPVCTLNDLNLKSARSTIGSPPRAR